MNDYLKFASTLARDAGELIVKLRKDANISHQFKADNELVTNADLQAMN